MQKLLRTTLFAAVLLLFGVLTAPAQTFEIEADSTQLAPSNDTTDVQCLVQLSSGTHVFFNTNAGGIYTWDGSSLAVHRSSGDLNNDVPDESNSFDNCDGVTREGNSIYFILRSSATDDNYVYRTDATDASNNSFVQFTGANGLAADASSVYIAGYEFFGAPANGIWEISDDLSGDTTRVATNSDLSIETIDVSDSGTLYGYSNEFGGGSFLTTIFTLNVTDSSPSFSSFVDPYGSGSPLTRDDSGNNDDIRDINLVTFGGTDYIVVYNNSFGASNGEEWGTIQISDQSIDLLFTESDLVSALPVSEFSGGIKPTAVNSSGEVFAASVSEFGASSYIAKVSGAPPLPVEMAGFDAVKNGSSVELTWQTASETNNAGFNVQLETENGWTTLGFVESKATGGTTTEALSYRYTVDRELDPGTHRFRLQQKDLDGSTSLSGVETIDVGLNAALTLQAPMPNPTRGQATVEFGVKEATETTVAVYNVLGQRVKTLYRGTPQTGQLTDVEFNASTLPSGVYFVRLRADGQTRMERLTVVR
jgi:hypothetical protein